jgi:eukaryotic-like serine/threonine-protein kinase
MSIKRPADSGQEKGQPNERLPRAVEPETLSPPDPLDDGDSFLQFLTRYWPRQRHDCHPTVTLVDNHRSRATSSEGLARFIGRFDVRSELGRGGFATVYLAHDSVCDRDVAIKVLHPEMQHSAELRRRFEREADAAASLDHPFINRIYETGETATGLYIVSHYCDGPTLAEWLRRRLSPVSPESACRLLMMVAGAVAHAHERGILHRDLKPSNVLLERPAPEATIDARQQVFEGFVPRLCDFGLARTLDRDSADPRTRTGAILGTPRYMAPEQAAGKSDVGPWTDLYALGVILYELLIGRPPFVADTDFETLRQIRDEEPLPLRRLQPKVPRDLETICMKCLEKEPERRYASAGDLAADLRRFLDRAPIKATPTSFLRRTRLWARRHPTQGLVVLSALLLLVALPSGLAWHTAQLEQAIRRAKEFENQARASERSALANQASVLQHMYSSDMRLADELLKDGEYAAVSALVDRHDLSHEGLADRRGFEWWYLRRFRDAEQRTWQAHAGELNMLALSADNRTLMTASYADQSAKTWDLETGALLVSFPTRKWDEPRDHEVGALSPDGKLAVTLVNDNTAVVWDARTGERKMRWTQGGKIFSIRFSPDNRLLAAAIDQGTAIWHCGEWDKPKYRLPGARLIEFSADSQSLAMVPPQSWTTDVLVYDGSDFTLKTKIAHLYPVLDMAFAPDGRTLATVADGPKGSGIQLLNPQTGQWIENLIPAEISRSGVSYSPNGKWLAGATRDGILHFWDLESYQARYAFRGSGNRITRFNYSPDGRSLVTSTDRGSVSVWNTDLLVSPQPVRVRSQLCPGRIAFNPRKNQIAVAERDRTVALFDAATGRIDSRLVGNLEHIEDLAFSPDGLRVATVDGRHLRCWEAATGRPVWRREASGTRSVAWSRLGVVATGGDDHHVRLFDAATGKETALLKGHSDKVTMVRFFPDGKRLASCGFDAMIRIWDVAARREATPPIEHLVPTYNEKKADLKIPVLSVAVSPDGRELAAGLPLGNLIVWKLENPESPRRMDVTWPARYSAWAAGQAPQIAYSPDGSQLGTAGPGGVFRVLHRGTREPVFALNGRGVAPSAAVWAADGKALAAVTDANEVTLWNPVTWQGRRIFGGPLAVVCALAFSSDGKTVVVGTDRAAGLESSREIELHVPPNVRLPPPAPGASNAKMPSSDAFRDYVPWQSTTDTLRFWDVDTSAERTLLDPLPTLSALPNVAWSQSRQLIAAASRDGSIWVWQAQSHRLLAHLLVDGRIRNAIEAARAQSPALVPQQALPVDVTASLLAFSPDCAYLAACTRAGTVRLWDTADWHEHTVIPTQSTEIKLLGYSPDGATLVLNDRGQVKLYDPLTGRLRFVIGVGTDAAVSCGRFSPDGRLLAVGVVDGRVRLIDMASHALSAALVGHVDTVSAMDFTPDGRTLATGGCDATVRLWDVASKREVAVLNGHLGRVHAVAFSPDGTVLASGGEIDMSTELGLGELFLWRSASREMVDHPKQHN